jgi:alpha-tubulin suppressor-like RCC1 family protein
MPNQFFSPEGDLENYFVTEYWLIDQYVGDELWNWGSGNDGRLGNGATTGNISTPITTFAGGTNWKQVSCGSRHIAAIKTDGTLWTWGYGGNGRLGTNDTTNRSTPVTTFAGGTNWKLVSSGGYFTAAIKTDGTLWTWGLGTSGRLGNGVTTGNISTPVTTFAGGNNWKQVACLSHIAAIKTDGTLWTWGAGTNGILGNAQTTNRSTPVTVFGGGTNWKQVSCGTNHTAAVKTDGTLWTWGSPNYGRMGILASSGLRSTPVTTFAGETNWKQVTCNDRHTAAVKTDGTLWTWGYTSAGQLGNGVRTAGERITPITTFAGGTNWKQVSCGSQHTVATKTDGTLWAWGNGGNGRLGNTTVTLDISTPVTTFAGGTNWKQVTTGGTHTAAVFSGTTPDLPIS